MATDIFEALIADHEEMRELMDKVAEEYDEKTFDQFASLLTSHMEAEEATLYSEVEDDQSVRPDVLEGYEEHHLGTFVERELERNQGGSERWMAKMTVLKEITEHHLDEEEQVLFPECRALIGEDRAKELGKQYEEQSKS